MLTDSGLDTYLRKHTAQEEQNLLGATNDYPGIETITTASGELCYCFTPTPLSMQMALSENKVLANYQNFAVIKQDRFETVPLHIHEWLELCYKSCALPIALLCILVTQFSLNWYTYLVT